LKKIKGAWLNTERQMQYRWCVETFKKGDWYYDSPSRSFVLSDKDALLFLLKWDPYKEWKPGLY
jgi:hypothetical protein